jgi:hypothetical protein
MAVGKNIELEGGQYHGGNHIKILVIAHRGKENNKNGRRLPNLPGFLLSVTTPKIIEKNAEIKTLNERPIEARAGSRLTV